MAVDTQADVPSTQEVTSQHATLSRLKLDNKITSPAALSAQATIQHSIIPDKIRCMSLA